MQTNFTLRDFQDEKFSSADFVNNILEKAISSNVDFSSLEACNLADLNRSIENALKSLKALQLEINQEMEGIKLEKELNHSSLERSQTKLANEMTTMKGEFEGLEKKITKIAEKSLAIGTHLSQLDKEKEAAILTSELIDYFLAFNTPDPNTLPEIFRDMKNYEAAAKYIYFLNEIAKNLTTSEYNVATKNISDKYEQVKKVLTLQYIDGVTKRDVQKLQRLLTFVVDFNLLYEVSLHYITSTLRAISSEMVFELRTMDENKKTIENTYLNLVRVLKNELTSEDNFFMQVLEDKNTDVVKLFISHIFENYVGKALEKIAKAFGKNDEVYLKYYEVIYIRTEELVQDIFKMDFPQASELHETARAHFHNVYDEYQASYFPREAHYLTNLLEKNVERIQKQLEKIKEKEVQIVKAGAKTLNVGDVNKLEKFKLSREEATSRIELLRDILMHEGTEIMFSTLDQSVQRCINICKFDEKNNNAIFLATKFLEIFGNKLLTMLVEFTTQIVPDLSRKVELNENFFEIIFKLNSMVQRVEISLFKCVRDLVKDRKYEGLMEKKEKIKHALEQKIERSLQKANSSLIISANRILVTSQDRNEYNLKPGVQPQGPSASSRNCIEFLIPYINQIKSSYSENIKRRILSSLGSQLTNILIDHFGEVKVNLKGLGHVVIVADVGEYEKLIEDFDDPNVMEGFEVLRALVHVYKKADKEDLNSYLKNEVRLKSVPSTVIDKYKYNR